MHFAWTDWNRAAQTLLDGAGCALGAPLVLGALLATCLLLGTARRPPPPALVALLLAAAAGTRWLPVMEPRLVLPGLLLALGLLLVLECRWRGLLAAGIAVAGGLGAGLGSGMQLATGLEMAGGVLALGTLLALAMLVLAAVPRIERLAAGAVVGRRMAGAWIAAIGALLLALWLRPAGVPGGLG